MTSLVLSASEIEALTGYKKPTAQLVALKAQGFHRARRSPLGHVVLERAHYEAVCAGQQPPQATPQLRPVKPRLRAVT